MISPQLEPEGINMNLTPNSDAASASSTGSRQSESEIEIDYDAASASSTGSRQSESEIEIDYEMMVGSTSSPSPFGAKSLIKSTEMAWNVGAKSLMVSSSPDVVPIEEDDENEDEDDERSGDLSDEMDYLNHHPVEDVPSLEKFMKEQNKANYCCDTAIENCLACSMIPEDFVEKVLCRMDKTLCTCQVTDWVDSTSNFCGVKKNKPKVLVDHDLLFEGTETESLTGSMCSYNGSLLDDDDDDEEDEIFNSIESEIPLIRHTHFQQKENMDPPVTNEEIKSVEEKPKEKKKKKVSLWSFNTERVKDKKNEKTIDNVVDNSNEAIIENVMDNEKEEAKGTAQTFSFDFDNGEEMLTEKRIETVLDNEVDAKSEDADDSKCEIVVTGLPSFINPFNIFTSSSANNEVTATSSENIADKVVEVDSEKVIEMAMNDNKDGDGDGDGDDSNVNNQEKVKNTDEDGDSNRDGALTCLPSCMYPLSIFTSSANEVTVSERIADEVEVDNEKRIETGFLNDDVDDENNQEQEIAKKIDEDVNDTKCDVVPTRRPFNMYPFNLFKSTQEDTTNTVEGDKKNIETMMKNEEESKNEDVGGDDTSTPSSIMDSVNLFKSTIEDTTKTEEGDKKNIEAMLNNEEELKNEHGDDASTTSSMIYAINLFTSSTKETISNKEEVEKKKGTETVLNNVTEDEINTDNKDDNNIHDVVLTRIPSLMNPLNLCKPTIDDMTEMIDKTIVTVSNNVHQETTRIMNKMTTVTVPNDGDQETDDDNIYDAVLTRIPSLINPLNFCKSTIDDMTGMIENDNKKSVVTVSNNGDQEMAIITDKMTTDTVSNNSDQETASITDNKRTAPQLSPKIDNRDSVISNKADTPDEKEEENEDNESGFECVLQRKIKSFEEEEIEKSIPFVPFSPPKTMEEKRMIQPIVTPSPEIPKKKKKSMRSRFGNLSFRR
jgi:hypothetical protein